MRGDAAVTAKTTRTSKK